MVAVAVAVVGGRMERARTSTRFIMWQIRPETTQGMWHAAQKPETMKRVMHNAWVTRLQCHRGCRIPHSDAKLPVATTRLSSRKIIKTSFVRGAFFKALVPGGITHFIPETCFQISGY